MVFGGARVGDTGTLELSMLNGSNGFKLSGVAAFDESGFSVSNAGDVNGDGVDDILIGAAGADPNGSESGASYVVFGEGARDLGLTVSGSCPGQVTVAISGASPGGSVALVRGSGPGSFIVPGGPCQGFVLGLEDVQLVRYLTADPNGEFQGTRAVAGSECGIPLQAADVATCTASNVASIPSCPGRGDIVYNQCGKSLALHVRRRWGAGCV